MIKIFSSARSLKQYRDYFCCKLRSNGVLSRNNLLRIKYGEYVINLDDKKSKGTHWVLLFIDRNLAVTMILLKLTIFFKKY